MEVSKTFTCPCRPGFNYVNIMAHRKTKMHQAWEAEKDSRDVRARAKQFENEIERLKNRLIHRENVEKELLARIHVLEETIKYKESV